jgi:hypothetical protein
VKIVLLSVLASRGKISLSEAPIRVHYRPSAVAVR